MENRVSQGGGHNYPATNHDYAIHYAEIVGELAVWLELVVVVVRDGGGNEDQPCSC